MTMPETREARQALAQRLVEFRDEIASTRARFALLLDATAQLEPSSGGFGGRPAPESELIRLQQALAKLKERAGALDRQLNAAPSGASGHGHERGPPPAS